MGAGTQAGARIRRAAHKELRRIKGLSLHADREAASARDAATADSGAPSANKPTAGAEAPDRVAFRDLAEGEGREAVLGARVKLHYKVALTDGTEVDSSGRRPLAVRLGGGEAIAGLDQGACVDGRGWGLLACSPLPAQASPACERAVFAHW